MVPLLWFTVDLVYYGIQFGLHQLRGNLYLNGTLSGIAELAGFALGGVFASTCLGRKYSTVLCFAIGGLSCSLYQMISNEYLSYALVLTGKFGASAVFCLVYLITTEMFPTVIRGTIFGIANVSARIGGIITPLVDGLMPKSFMIVFGLMGMLSALGSLFLNETRGKPLQDVFESE